MLHGRYTMTTVSSLSHVRLVSPDKNVTDFCLHDYDVNLFLVEEKESNNGNSIFINGDCKQQGSLTIYEVLCEMVTITDCEVDLSLLPVKCL